MTFKDSIGINIHLAYTNTQYGNTAQVVAWLQQLGIKHVRDGLPRAAWTTNFQRYALLKSAGIDVLGVAGWVDNTKQFTPVTMAEMVQILAQGNGVFSVVEGPNERDVSGVPLWEQGLLNYLPQLYTAVNGELPVLGPSMARAYNYGNIGNIEPWEDKGSLHVYYAGGRPDGGWLQVYINEIRKCTPTKPIVVTETGYYNDGGAAPIDELVATKYLLRTILFNYGKVDQTYIYQLLDQSADVPPNINPQNHYGLIRYDWTLKPAFTAIQNLLSICGDGIPTPLNVGLQTDTKAELATIQHVKLYNPTTGRYLIALWQAVPASGSYSYYINVLVKTSLENVTFAQTHNLITGETVQISNPSSNVNVPVTDSVTVLEMI